METSTTRITWQDVLRFANARTLNPVFEESFKSQNNQKQSPVAFMHDLSETRWRFWIMVGIGITCFAASLSYSTAEQFTGYGVDPIFFASVGVSILLMGIFSLIMATRESAREFRAYLKALNDFAGWSPYQTTEFLALSTPDNQQVANGILVAQAFCIVGLQQGGGKVSPKDAAEELRLKVAFTEMFNTLTALGLVTESSYDRFYDEALRLYKKEAAPVGGKLDLKV